MKDYYRVLGVEKGADAQAIKAAYRGLIKRYHPDRNGGDKAAEAKCCEINEAYETLGNAEKRRAYDEAREAARRAPRRAAARGAASGHAGDFRVEDILSDLFGGFSATRPGAARDTRATLSIPPWTAALGGRVDLRVGAKTLSLKIPPNTRAGQVLRLRGQGDPAPDGKPGDLLLTLALENPSPLTPDMRALYEKMAALR